MTSTSSGSLTLPEVEETQLKRLAKVKADLTEKLKRERAVELARADGEAKLEQLRKGADPGIKWGAPRTVSRRDAQGSRTSEGNRWELI